MQYVSTTVDAEGVSLASFKTAASSNRAGAGSAAGCIVVWSGTHSSLVRKAHAVQLPKGTTVATLVDLVGNSTVGNQSALPMTGGKVTIDVSEMPVVILLGVPPIPPTGPVPPIQPPTSPLCQPGSIGLFCLNSSMGDARCVAAG